jgi:uncharacterized protein (DUF305 family)
MKNNIVFVAVLCLALGFGIGYLASGDNGSEGNLDGSMMRGNGMMGKGNMMGRNIDQHFIEQMIPYHDDAIAMSKIALDRSKRPEILSLAEGIISAQELENKDMRRWYESWFGVPVRANASMGMPMNMMMATGGNDLSNVSEVQFDKAFLEAMIPHHQSAIMMARMLASATERPEMQTLADNIITSQSRPNRGR